MKPLKDIKTECFPRFGKNFISSDDQIVNTDWSRSHRDNWDFDCQDFNLGYRLTRPMSNVDLVAQHLRLLRRLKDFL